MENKIYIQKSHWIFAFLVTTGILYLIKAGGPASFSEAIGAGFGTIIIIAVMLLVIMGISKLLKKETSARIQYRAFYLTLLCSLLIQVSTQARTNSKIRKRHLVNQCIKQLKESGKSNAHILDYDLLKYCECAVEKIQGLSVADSAVYNNPNSSESMELYGKCWESAQNNAADFGLDSSIGPDTLKVINLTGSIRVKVIVNGVEQYMIFDSGSADVLLSKSFLNQFSDESLVRYTNDHSYYNMADGSELKARIAYVARLQIGKFLLKDVKVAVIDSLRDPLLGKSILDQFESWTINSDNQLILAP